MSSEAFLQQHILVSGTVPAGSAGAWSGLSRLQRLRTLYESPRAKSGTYSGPGAELGLGPVPGAASHGRGCRGHARGPSQPACLRTWARWPRTMSQDLGPSASHDAGLP